VATIHCSYRSDPDMFIPDTSLNSHGVFVSNVTQSCTLALYLQKNDSPVFDWYRLMKALLHLQIKICPMLGHNTLASYNT